MIDSLSEIADASADLKKSRRRRAAIYDATKVDRLPPHSHEAEQGVLGCILLSPKECLGHCIEKLGESTREIFYDLRHQTIFDALAEMYDKQEAIDVITLQQRLKDKQLLEQIGGIAYLSGLPDVVPSAANVGYYAEIVFEKYLLRRLLQKCADISRMVYQSESEAGKILAHAEREILRIGEAWQHLTFVDINETLNGVTERVARMTDSKKCIGMETGFPDLDALTGGYDSGLHIISGERSVGKTSLAMTIADFRIFAHNEKVCFISLETSAIPFMTRMVCNRQRIDSRAMRSNPTTAELLNFSKGVGTFRRAKDRILLYEDSGMTSQQIRSVCRRGKKDGAKLFIVDFLQIILSNDHRHNDTERISKVVYEMKDMSKELQSPVILLSALSRSGELRGSGLADNAAETHLKLVKPKEGRKEDKFWEVRGILDKGKDCGEGEVNFGFHRNYFLYCPHKKINEEDMP